MSAYPHLNGHGVNLQIVSLLGIARSIQIYTEKSCLSTLHPKCGLDWGQGYISKIIFAMNQMKCPDLHRKIMFANPHSHWSGGGLGSTPNKLFLLGIEQKIEIYIEN